MIILPGFFFQCVIVHLVMLPETLTKQLFSASMIATKLHILLARVSSFVPFLPPNVACDTVLIVAQ